MSELPAAMWHRLEQLLPPEVVAAHAPAPASIAYAALTDWLHQRILAVSEYSPRMVVRHHLGSPQPGEVVGSLRPGSLIFADLSGFTALSERLATLGKEGSEEITRIVNQVFAALADAVEEFGGDIIKFNGDALTVFFDAEERGAEHAVYATCAAQRMTQQMAALSQVTTRLGSFPLAIRIGVHSGEVFAALVGAHSQELVLLGEDLNRVAAAQEIARPGELILSAATLKLLPALRSVSLPGGFARLDEPLPLRDPRPALPLVFPSDTNDPAELSHMLDVYDALRRFLPAQLPEAALLSQDLAATSGLRLAAALFANIQPFGALIRTLRHEPAQITPLINRYYCQMQRIALDYGGTINKLDLFSQGDKLLAIFGAPIAHENDAELALRAALEMQEAINQLNGEFQGADARLPLLDQRIGINQGHMFAGLVGGRRRREYTVMGDPVNLAARLMDQAPPGDILVGPAIRRHTTSFEFETLPGIRVKGKREPIEAARVTQIYAVRRQAAHAPLIGREAELRRITALAAEALRGSGQVLLLTGEAGIGKSRLIEEALQWLALHSFDADVDIPIFTPCTLECQFYEQATPYAAARDLLSQLLRVPTTGDNKLRGRLLRQRVAQLTPDLLRFVPVLADMLSVPLEDNPLTASLTPLQRHTQALELGAALVLAAARQTPLVILWDDAQWNDGSSQQLLDVLAQRVEQAPLLLLVGYRTSSEVLPYAWATEAQHIALSELSDTEQLAMAQALLEAELPAELVGSWRASDGRFFNPQGNPFFIEELIRALLDQQILVRGATGWRVQGSIDALPSTIEGVITARLDRLAVHERETLQIASVIGRRFQTAILHGLSETPLDLPRQLQYLTEVNLILPDQLTLDPAYLFKHTLTRDVAYDSILYARRRLLHQRVAEQIERSGVDQQDVLPLLAHHYSWAELWPLAIRSYLAAGRNAQAAYANQEALSHFQVARALLAEHGPADPLLELELTEREGYVHLLAGKYEAARACLHASLEQATVLARPALETARILRHLATVFERIADYEEATAAVEQGLALLGLDDSLERVRLLLLGSGILQRQARSAAAIQWAQDGLASATRLGAEPEEASAFYLLGGNQRFQGHTEQALASYERSVALYKRLNNPGKLADAYINMAISLSDSRRYTEAIELYQQAHTLKLLVNDGYGQALVLLNLGDALRKCAAYPAALEASLHSLRHWQQLGARYPYAACLINIASIYCDLHDLPQALTYLQQSETLLDALEISAFHPEIYRLYGQIHERQGDDLAAMDALSVSIRAAQALGARLEEGLTQLAYGRLLVASQPLLAFSILSHAAALLEECDDPTALAECHTQLTRLSDASPAQ